MSGEEGVIWDQRRQNEFGICPGLPVNSTEA